MKMRDVVDRKKSVIICGGRARDQKEGEENRKEKYVLVLKDILTDEDNIEDL